MEAKDLLEEYLVSGHGACPGCAMPVVMRHAFHALGPRTVSVVTASCYGTIISTYPFSPVKICTYTTPFASAASAASGIKAALDQHGDFQTTVLAVAGDGGTFDIGIQALSAAAERNDDFIFLCYDNEAYMNTGIQRSSATPWGAWTTTTPPLNLKSQPKKDIVEIMAAHRIPYAATVSIAYPEDFARKIRKAKETRGLKFHLCPFPLPGGLAVLFGADHPDRPAGRSDQGLSPLRSGGRRAVPAQPGTRRDPGGRVLRAPGAVLLSAGRRSGTNPGERGPGMGRG